MQATDVAECADMVAAHPLIGPRYGASIKHLAPAWLQLVECQSMRAIVFEELEGTRVILWGLGVTVVVEDRFLNELKCAPFWFGPELATRIVQGRSPVLSDKEFWEANSKEGLNLIVWEGFPRQGFDHRSELYQKLVTSFIEVHRGLFWREAITAQCETAQRLDWAMGAGGMLWDPGQNRYLGSPDRKAEEIIRAPHIVGLTREIELARPGSWVGALFHYHPPCIGLSRSEQRLLLAALAGMTDEELSSALGVSVPAVKKAWLSIYRRFAEHLPEVVPDEQPKEEQRGRRGKEKRRRVLSYLREHPEELQMGSQRIPNHTIAQRMKLPRAKQLS